MNLKNYNRRVYLRITNICNKACDFCFYRNETAPKAFMTLDTVKQIIQQEYAQHDFSKGPLYVQLTGGEPSLHPQLSEIIQLILSYADIQLYMETNGSNLKNHDYLQLFKRFPNKIHIKISMNTELITPESEWLENVLYLRACQLPVTFTFMARYKTEEDKKFLEQLIEENNLNWKFLYPIDYNRDYINGKTNRIQSCIIYTVDGTVLVDMTKKNKKGDQQNYGEDQSTCVSEAYK